MRNRCIGLVLVMQLALTFAPSLLAQTASKSAPAKTPPDLSGTWFHDAPILPSGHHARNFMEGEEPPMQPWALERYNAARKLRFNMEDSRGPDEINPNLYPFCEPPSMPEVFGENLFEIMENEGHVYLIFESNAVQRIYTDGRKHPEAGPFTFMGHSIGKWEGNELVVDTINIIGLDGWAWMDSMGHPRTEALHVTQRFRRPTHNRLEIEFTLDDPKAYTKPWGGTRYFQLKSSSDPKWEPIESHTCEDLMRKEFLKKMETEKQVLRSTK